MQIFARFLPLPSPKLTAQAPENRPSQKDVLHLSTLHFQVFPELLVSGARCQFSASTGSASSQLHLVCRLWIELQGSTCALAQATSASRGWGVVDWTSTVSRWWQFYESNQLIIMDPFETSFRWPTPLWQKYALQNWKHLRQFSEWKKNMIEATNYWGLSVTKRLGPDLSLLLLMEEIRPTSWYGKYHVIYSVSYMLGG